MNAESDDQTPSVPPLHVETIRLPIPITTRLAIEIPKPKDWQAFQRNCVLLFQAVLNDPHAQEYGRVGQNQRGIDILGRRNGRDDHFVGIQCRLIEKPLKKDKILTDARASLGLKAGLSELIFATTAPDDTHASDAAIEAERELRSEGHNLKIVVYGWGQLQTLIAPHDVAYNAFHPSAVASSVPQTPWTNSGEPDFAFLVAKQVAEQLREATFAVAPRDDVGVASVSEDPALHARIDTFRDLLKEEQPLLAEKGLLQLLEDEELSEKPWAHFRIQTNLGSLDIALGREAEAAVRFEAAHAIRPDDPKAQANLALARTIQGRYDEAMSLAQKALDGEPRANHAIGYLLQAAARSNWTGDPEALIPEDLVGTEHADIGLAEFLRRRDVPGWAERSLEMARRHSKVADFKRIRAIAALSLVSSTAIIAGGHSPVSMAELNSAADDLKAIVDHYLNMDFADAYDLGVHLSNAALLLRFCGRHDESETLLLRGIHKSDYEHQPQLRRLLAFAQLEQDRQSEALAILADDPDPENQILRVELLAAEGEHEAALNAGLTIDTSSLTDRLRRLLWCLLGELSLHLGDDSNLTDAIKSLRALDENDVAASLFEIRKARKTAKNDDLVRDQLKALATSSPPELETRYFLARELFFQGLEEEASRLLDGLVDLSRPSPAASLYIQSLAAARRDDTFRSVLNQASSELRSDRLTLWTVAAHAWNLGDLDASMVAVESLLEKEPDNPRARLLRIEILIRQDQSAPLLAELEKPLERLAWRRPDEQFRLASLLGHFGFTERAADLAYRLFLQHRDQQRAWMTLSMLVLDEGRGNEHEPHLWGLTQVTSNAAVNLAYDDGEKTFFVVEPEADLRKLDPESWEPGHALVRVVSGLCVGHRFVGPDGRHGVIREIRHKYVARLHFVMENYQTRFPEITGFQRISVNPASPGGLDTLTARAKARHDWIQEEEDQYLNGPNPIGLLAHRVGTDTIEASAGIVMRGAQLKVAEGNHEETVSVQQAIRGNDRRGCVLDLLAFWTAWRLEALDAIRSTCGPIHLPQSVLDRLRERRENFEDGAQDGLKLAGYENGRLAVQEIPADLMRQRRDEVDRAIIWAEENTTISPILLTEDLPAGLRELLRSGHSDIFDSLVLARQKVLLLVTDDLQTRKFSTTLRCQTTWLHAVFDAALKAHHIDADRYVQWSAHLIGAGHNYLGISYWMLSHAALSDAANGESPGYLLRALSQMIGGPNAEPTSHVDAVVRCLRDIWTNRGTTNYRQPVTGFLLRQLVRGRVSDYSKILRTALNETRDLPELSSYIMYWLRGHFLVHGVLNQS